MTQSMPNEETADITNTNSTKIDAPTTNKDEEKPSNSTPSPLQIVKIGTEEDEYAFTFNESNLNSVLSQVPVGWKVSVISVVGAFRTGKSFLLSWFLQYLNRECPGLVDNGDDKDAKEKWYEQVGSVGPESGFHWLGGVERQTTGIWMWSEPFYVKRDNGDLAVLLIDTQGMFDHETTMAVTASIFGLSTLISSYQIFNVDKRIQEDHLQQLALFSEYGRMAISEETKTSSSPNKDKSKDNKNKPFQHIDFLVRDWQNFDCDGEGPIPKLEKEMDDYLDHVIDERAAKDLQDTREQINSCFSSIECFLMTHPGRDVTKKKYKGEVDLVDPTFLRLLDRYCYKVFGSLKPKMIQGRELMAAELLAYMKAYANLFATGAKFPEASTMLEATATANNVNATHTSLDVYKSGMDELAGANCTRYVRQEDLETSHRNLMKEATLVFDDMANFGNPRAIEEVKGELMNDIFQSYELYCKINEGRNPFSGLEIVIVPLIITVVSLIMRKFTDYTCSDWSQTCKATSEVLAETSGIVFFFLIIVFATKAREFSDFIKKLKTGYDAVFGGGFKPKAD